MQKVILTLDIFDLDELDPEVQKRVIAEATKYIKKKTKKSVNQEALLNVLREKYFYLGNGEKIEIMERMENGMLGVQMPTLNLLLQTSEVPDPGLEEAENTEGGEIDGEPEQAPARNDQSESGPACESCENDTAGCTC